MLGYGTVCRTNFFTSPYFSHGQLLFDEGEVDRRKTIRTVAPKALIAIWF
jgi:hypothetical protein